MGKTFRREKTVDYQRKKLNKNRKSSKPRFEEFDFDSNVDSDRGLSDAKTEIPTDEELRKQRHPQSPNQTDN